MSTYDIGRTPPIFASYFYKNLEILIFCICRIFSSGFFNFFYK